MSTAATAPPPTSQVTIDVEPEFLQFFQLVQPCSMVGLLRMHSLYTAVRYVVANGIPGDLVECGVYRGGCCMLMALTLRSLGDAQRRIFLYDTFTGMAEPTDADVSMDGKKVARDLWAPQQTTDHNDWCYAGRAEVEQNLRSTGFAPDRLVFVEGRTQDTIPATRPDRIALLRLDTDWYESTYHELTHLYPSLSTNGVLISDDYAIWRGHRRAIDQYLAEQGIHPLISRTACGAIMLKTVVPT